MRLFRDFSTCFSTPFQNIMWRMLKAECVTPICWCLLSSTVVLSGSFNDKSISLFNPNEFEMFVTYQNFLSVVTLLMLKIRGNPHFMIYITIFHAILVRRKSLHFLYTVPSFISNKIEEVLSQHFLGGLLKNCMDYKRGKEKVSRKYPRAIWGNSLN